MEVMGSLWNCQEQNENVDELKQKLLTTSFELESLKMDIKERVMRNEENTTNLLFLLNSVCRERDEARNQLQEILHEIAAADMKSKELPESHVLVNSCSIITGSDSFYNNHQHAFGSSPVDSVLDAVTSSEFSYVNAVDDHPIFEKNYDYDCFPSLSSPVISSGKTTTDPADALIDNLLRGKLLPQKGILLQDVVESSRLYMLGTFTDGVQPIKIPPWSTHRSSGASRSHTFRKAPWSSSP